MKAPCANCDECPLQFRPFVNPKLPTEGDLGVAVVAGAPRGEDVESGHLLTSGGGGMMLAGALRPVNVQLRQLHLTAVVLCQPPGDDMKQLLQKISKYNRAEKKKARAEKREPAYMKTPIECCAPRLKNELRGYKKFLTLGTRATTAVAGSTSSILTIRGGLIELGTEERVDRQVMPTLSPNFVRAQQRWTHAFLNDVRKAVRWFRGEAGWVPPRVTYNPSPRRLRAFLRQKLLRFTFDIETDAKECLDAHIRCIAIGTSEEVMVVGFRSNVRPKNQPGLFLDFYPEHEHAEIGAILRDFFEDESILKVGHNAGYYDFIVLRERMGIVCRPVADTMLFHRNVESELPHSLAYVASIYTEAPSWKQDRAGNKIALGGENDHQLHEYCANDVAITDRVFEPLVEQTRLREQGTVWRSDQRMQIICADMHTVGMYVDQKERLETERRLMSRRHRLLTEIRDLTELGSFNPMSVYQMRDLLFDRWDLESHLEATDLREKDLMTGSGDRSTADLILRKLLTLKTVDAKQRQIIKLIRRYRKCLKVLGTYVVKLRPSNMGADIGWDEDEDWADAESRKKYGERKMGIVDPRTGRMHPGYNCHVAVTGRLSSSQPINAQNFPSDMRKMVRAAPGHVLVGADMDQVELRIAAALWGVDLYLRAFREGKDPHSMTAFAVFGTAFCTAAGLTPDQFARPGKLVGLCYDDQGVFLKGKSKAATDMRNLSKAVQYASQYMASVETVHQLIQKTELPALDPTTKEPLGDGITALPYALMPLRRVRKMRDAWLKGAPEFETGWEREIEQFRDQGFLREPVAGRRRDFLDGEDPNQIVNFKVQGSAAGLMNRALIGLHEDIPLHKWGPGTGIVSQCHDSIMVECPEDKAEEVAELLEHHMNQRDPALPGVDFSASADIGMTWKEVG